jgi:hypothetical protein
MGLFDTKASLEVEKGGPIPFLFNPSELSMSLAAKWDSESDDEEPQFKGMETETLSFTLLLDTTQNPGKSVTTPADKPQPVTKWTSRLISLVRPDAVAGTNKNTNDERPPWVRFQWGDFVSFKAVVTSLDITFKLFSPSGVPLRAECAITLTKFEDDKSWPKQNPTSGTPARSVPICCSPVRHSIASRPSNWPTRPHGARSRRRTASGIRSRSDRAYRSASRDGGRRWSRSRGDHSPSTRGPR